MNPALAISTIKTIATILTIPTIKNLPREEIERRDAVSAADEEDLRARGREGEAVAERAHQVDAVALAHRRERGGAAADDLEDERQDARGGVGVADADRAAHRGGVERRHADVDELARRGGGGRRRRAEAQAAVSGAEVLEGQNGGGLRRAARAGVRGRLGPGSAFAERRRGESGNGSGGGGHGGWRRMRRMSRKRRRVYPKAAPFASPPVPEDAHPPDPTAVERNSTVRDFG